MLLVWVPCSFSLPSSSLCDHSTTCDPFFYRWTLDLFLVWTNMKKSLWILYYWRSIFSFFWWTYFFISLEQIPRRGISGLQGRCIFSFIKKIEIKTCQSVSRVVIQFNLTLTNTVGILVVLYLPTFGIVSLLNFSHSGGCSVASHCSLKLSFPHDYDVMYFFLCLLAIYIVSFLCEVSV